MKISELNADDKLMLKKLLNAIPVIRPEGISHDVDELICGLNNFITRILERDRKYLAGNFTMLRDALETMMFKILTPEDREENIED